MKAVVLHHAKARQKRQGCGWALHAEESILDLFKPIKSDKVAWALCRRVHFGLVQNGVNANES